MSPKKKRLVRAPKTRKPRKKQSWRNASGDWDDLSYDRQERVASPAERERRRQVVQESERAWLGTPQEEYRSDDDATGLLGVVTSVHGSLYMVELSGELVECQIRESLKDQETGFVNPVSVGDRVVVTDDGGGGYAIEELLERDSILTRPASFKGYLRQIVAANVDQLLIVTSWLEPAFWPELVDRYLVTADVHELDPVICVTKGDLIKDTEEFETAVAPYHDLDYPVVVTSTTTGDGLNELRKLLVGKSTVLSGLSGTGKSSLLNTLKPGLGLARWARSARGVDETREGTRLRGRRSCASTGRRRLSTRLESGSGDLAVSHGRSCGTSSRRSSRRRRGVNSQTAAILRSRTAPSSRRRKTARSTGNGTTAIR